MSDTAEATDDQDAMFEGGNGDSLSVDLSNIEEMSFEVLPKGTYDVIVDEAEYKISQSGGNPMIALTFKIEEGEYEGRKLFSNIVFSPKAMPFAKRDIARLGLNHLLEGPFNPEEAASEFIGQTCRVRVAIEKYEGEDQNRVKAILPAGGGDDFVTG